MIDKDKITEAIWAEPDKVTGLRFVMRGNAWQSRQRPDGTESNRPDKTILRRANDGHTIYVNYNGGSFRSCDIWDLLQQQNNTNDFAEVLRIAAEAYGIETEEDPAARERRRQQRTDTDIAKAAADYLRAQLKTDAGATAREYLKGRGFEISDDFGAFSSSIRAGLKKHITAALNLNERTAEDSLKRLFPVMNPDAYGLAIPYTTGGRVMGFCLRKTSTAETDNGPKYLYSKDMKKGGYCGPLNASDDVVLVEGLLDAIRVKQAGYFNVMALGGTTPTDNTDDPNKSEIKTLQRYGVKHLIYVPDYEHEAGPAGTLGAVKTKATDATIAAVLPHLSGIIDGKGFISLRIAELYTNDRKDITKDDADSYIKTNGPEAFDEVIDRAAKWYIWQLIAAARNSNPQRPDDLAEAAVKIYTTIANPLDREQLRRAINAAESGSILDKYRAAGVTAETLRQIDRTGQASTYRSKMAAAVGDLNAAVERNATAETIGDLLRKADKVQHHTGAASFTAQVEATPEQLAELIINKPDYLQTDWQLWGREKGEIKEIRRVSFAPANVSIIAAPSSHGKTLVMIATALHLVQKYHKRFLYVSLENDLEQLYIRALAAYMGREYVGENELRKELRNYFKTGAEDLPAAGLFYGDPQADYGTKIEDYHREVSPYLRFARISGDIDELCNNVTSIVEDWTGQGIEVGGVFLDYVQSLHVNGRNYSRTDELKAICDELNDLAKTTGLPIIAAAQMNRQSTKNNGDGIDGVSLANLGESANLENIAEDCYLVWSTEKIKESDYTDGNNNFNVSKAKYRSRRIIPKEDDPGSIQRNCIYIESLKARESGTGCYCLLPVDFKTGAVMLQEGQATTYTEKE